jgi:hypothetical protein
VLAEPDEITIAFELAVREVPAWEAILKLQLERTDPDRKARFAFVMPAPSADAAVRERAFERFRDVENRRREPWVLESLQYLNHPLRETDVRRFVAPALELLREIQQTGDNLLSDSVDGIDALGSPVARHEGHSRDVSGEGASLSAAPQMDHHRSHRLNNDARNLVMAHVPRSMFVTRYRSVIDQIRPSSYGISPVRHPTMQPTTEPPAPAAPIPTMATPTPPAVVSKAAATSAAKPAPPVVTVKAASAMIRAPINAIAPQKPSQSFRQLKTQRVMSLPPWCAYSCIET